MKKCIFLECGVVYKGMSTVKLTDGDVTISMQFLTFPLNKLEVQKVGAKSNGPGLSTEQIPYNIKLNSGHYVKLILTRLFGELTEKERNVGQSTSIGRYEGIFSKIKC